MSKPQLRDLQGKKNKFSWGKNDALIINPKETQKKDAEKKKGGK